MATSGKPPNDLDLSPVDYTVVGLKSLLGAIPFAGTAVSEIVGQFIPGQRIDRVCRFLTELDERLSKVEASSSATQDPRFIDLFEDATLQSLRALTNQRTTQLVNFLAGAVAEGQPGFDVDKRLLQIMGELTDTEVAILQSHEGLEYVHLQRQFYCDSLAIGQYKILSDADKNNYDSRRVAWDLHVSALHRLGLLTPKIRAIGPTRSDFEFDEDTGLPKHNGYRMTSLGRLLLRRIGALKSQEEVHP